MIELRQLFNKLTLVLTETLPYPGPSAYAHTQPLITPEPMTEHEVKVLRLPER